MLTPLSSTVPCARAFGVTSCMRFRQRIMVLLPQPEGPMMAVTWRGAMCSWMLEIAWRSPYQAFKSRTTTLGPCALFGSSIGVSGGVKTDCWVAITATLIEPPCNGPAAEQTEHTDKDDQDERGSPGLDLKVRVGRAGVCVNLYRQRRHRLEQVETEKLIAQGCQ